MSGHLATSAVRRRWALCKTYARQQDASWPRREREARPTSTQDGSARTYLAFDAQGDSRGLELAIVQLLVGSPEYPRQVSLAALSAVFEPVRPAELQAALRQLEAKGVVIRSQDGLGLSRPVRRLVDLGLIPQA